MFGYQNSKSCYWSYIESLRGQICDKNLELYINTHIKYLQPMLLKILTICLRFISRYIVCICIPPSIHYLFIFVCLPNYWCIDLCQSISQYFTIIFLELRSGQEFKKIWMEMESLKKIYVLCPVRPLFVSRMQDISHSSVLWSSLNYGQKKYKSYISNMNKK